jgi:hypothetical protein
MSLFENFQANAEHLIPVARSASFLFYLWLEARLLHADLTELICMLPI